MNAKEDKRTKDRIQMFLDRGHYSTPEQVISSALDLLTQDQINKDSKTWNDSQTSMKDIMSQLDDYQDPNPKE